MNQTNKKAITLLLLSGALASCGTTDSSSTQINQVDMKKSPPVYDKPKYQQPLPSNASESLKGAEFAIDPEPIFFGFNSTMINPFAMKMLENLAMDLKVYENIDTVLIEGHTDEVGSNAYNLDLGMQRALAVKDYLVFQGVNPSRLDAVSFGEARPVIDSTENDAILKNRRVIITIPRVTTNRLSLTD